MLLIAIARAAGASFVLASAVSSCESAPARSSPGRPPSEVASASDNAPDFTLKDLGGKPYHLADYRGKTVVLEWFNPKCPFVRLAHTKGSLKGAAKRHPDKGIVWLAINSAAPGKQGYASEENVAAVKEYAMEHPLLRDESGDVGHRYGATNTPHMFVISPQGRIEYRGAIDNSPDGEGESAPDGKVVNYVDAAVEDLAAGRAVRVRETKAYGCSVKYAD
jgi:peroxiredoxin